MWFIEIIYIEKNVIVGDTNQTLTFSSFRMLNGHFLAASSLDNKIKSILCVYVGFEPN